MSVVRKAYLFGPIKDVGIINEANVNIHSTLTSNAAAVGIKQKPGLDQFRNPTTNAAASIAPDLIKSGDNYAVITDFEDYFNGEDT